MKRSVCFWAAIALSIIAVLCGIEARTGGGDAYRAIALIALIFGMISAAGVWALGLPKSTED